MKLTVDANIVVKWVLPQRANEDHVPQALHLLEGVREGAIEILQPPHWLAETAVVIVRLQPKIATEAVDMLNALEFPVSDAPEIYHIACDLSEKFNHHLFDTLYHAVALFHGNSRFITADEKYYKKAYKEGNILRLADFSIFQTDH